MFFKDIDSWGKRKLALMTLLCGLCYIIFATIIPTIIISTKYDLTKNEHASLSMVGIIIIVVFVTAGVKGIKYVIDILPKVKRKQQIIRFGLELICAWLIPALILWLTFLIERELVTALYCIRSCCYCYFAAYFVEYTCLKTIEVQWSFEAKVDANEKEEAIKRARANN